MTYTKKRAITTIVVLSVAATIITLLILFPALAADDDAGSSIGSSIVNALYSLYGPGFVERIGEVIGYVVDAVEAACATGPISTIFTTFAGITASLVTIYFFFDIMDMLTREMFSLEKLMIAFIKMIAVVAVIACLPQITTWILELSKAVFGWINQILSDQMTGTSMASFVKYDDDGTGTEILTNKEDIQKAFDDRFQTNVFKFMRNLRLLVGHPFWTMEALIVSLVTAVLRLIVFFMVISSGIILIARIFFSPIGLVNLYRGAQSDGVHYFKQLLASACVFGAQLVVIMAASLIAQGLMGNDLTFFGIDGGSNGSRLIINVQDAESISDALNFSSVIVALIPQLAAIGGMGAATRIINDVFGARGG